MSESFPLIAAPEILAIAIIENQDPLINLKDQNQILIGPSPEIDNNQDYTWMRSQVFERLLSAQDNLPKGIRFCLYEAYRSLTLQGALFDTRHALLTAQHPDYSEKQLFEKTMELISPLNNLDGSRNIPPHSTGAAVDVYLVDEQGIELDMGIHPKDWMLDTEVVLSPTDSPFISSQAKRNRQIMCEALIHAGFCNYPTEYWHWSYGDRYWAYHNQKPYALYGCIHLKDSTTTASVSC